MVARSPVTYSRSDVPDECTSGGAERPPAPRRDLRRAGAAQGLPQRPAADRRGRRHRQDQHAGRARRAPGDQRRRSGADPDADVHAARGARDAPPRARHRQAGAAGDRHRHQPVDAAAHAVGRHLPRDRRPVAAPLRAPPEPRPEFHDPRSWRLGRPDRLDPRGARLRQARQALPAQGRLPRDLLAPRQHPGLAEGDAGVAVPVVRRLVGGTDADLPQVRRAQAAALVARLRRPAALLARDDAGAEVRAARLAALRPRARRRVPGHQPAAGRDPAGDAAGRGGPDRGRRRRAGDLFVPRRGGRQHPRLP